jgi:hypothetical protein
MDGPGVCMAEFSSNLSGARGDVANRSYTLIWDSGPRKFFHPAKKRDCTATKNTGQNFILQKELGGPTDP